MTSGRLSVKRIIFFAWTIFIGGILANLLIFILISNGLLGEMPSFEELENPKSNLLTEIISSDKNVLGTFYQENRSFVDYKDLSPNIVNALISTEDVRFRDHSGIDSRGLARVFFRTLLLGEKNSGGGSTLSQQLAKLLFHDPAKSTIERASQKLKEWIISVKLERSYTKDEILTMYLNKAPFIYDAYGIKSAAKTFFNTSTDSIKIEEAATIVGMLKNPALYNPIRRPELTMERRNVVLNQMKKAQHINQEEYDSLKTIPLSLDFNRADHKEGPAPYFREYLRLTLSASKPERKHYPSYLQQKFTEDSIEWDNNPLYGWINKNLKPDGTKYNIYRDGLKIYTTIDSRMQEYAENAVADHLGNYLQKAFFKEKKGRARAPFTNKISETDYKTIIDRAIRNSDRYRYLKSKKVSVDSINKVFKTPTDMQIFSWKGEIDTTLSPLDSIKYYKHFLRASLMSIDPHSGHVKAYVGGPNFKHFMYDMATKGKRQVGSTIKPFIYTLAMQEGHTPCDLVPNIPQTFYLPNGNTWTPKNSDSKRQGEMVSLKWGLANSNNNITAWIMKQYNPETAARMIKALGVKSNVDAVPAICLGTPDFTLMEMTSAYTAFPNKGVHNEPIMVTRICDKYSNVISEFQPQKREVISENTAYLMLELLKGVVNQGTGIRLRLTYEMLNEIGGKTGTTQNHSDGWFMGVVPNLVTGVWVGGEDRDIHFDGISLGQGANMALPIWALYMKQVMNDESCAVSAEDTFEKPLNFDWDPHCPDDSRRASDDDIENENPTLEDEFL